MKTLTFPFVCLPDAVVWKKIGSHAKVLYAALQSYRNRRTGQCNPKLATLAERLGKSVRTIRRALAELVRWGMIIVTRSLFGNRYEIATPDRWQPTISVTECEAKSDLTVGPNLSLPATDILIEPELLEPDERHDAADAVVNTPWQAAAAASTDVECEDEKPTPTPPAEGSSPGDPGIGETAQEIAVELMAVHPEPGNLPKAISEAEKLLASTPDAVPATVEALRTSHALWRVRWAEYGPGRFIPQLWRWIQSNDWRNAPLDRKGAKSETWEEKRNREYERHQEETYRMYAERGMWDAIREYGGPQAVEIWREKIKAEVA